jgi:hypothetical protein
MHASPPCVRLPEPHAAPRRGSNPLRVRRGLRCARGEMGQVQNGVRGCISAGIGTRRAGAQQHPRGRLVRRDRSQLTRRDGRVRTSNAPCVACVSSPQVVPGSSWALSADPGRKAATLNFHIVGSPESPHRTRPGLGHGASIRVFPPCLRALRAACACPCAPYYSALVLPALDVRPSFIEVTPPGPAHSVHFPSHTGSISTAGLRACPQAAASAPRPARPGSSGSSAPLP